MVQFNPNLNVGKTASLKPTTQVDKTEGSNEAKQPKAEKDAVWIQDAGNYGDRDKWRKNDVVLTIWANGTVSAFRIIGFDPNTGEMITKKIPLNQIADQDYEINRGHVNDPLWFY